MRQFIHRTSRSRCAAPLTGRQLRLGKPGEVSILPETAEFSRKESWLLSRSQSGSSSPWPELDPENLQGLTSRAKRSGREEHGFLVYQVR